jgi:hypothetical protein
MKAIVRTPAMASGPVVGRTVMSEFAVTAARRRGSAVAWGRRADGRREGRDGHAGVSA